MPEGRLTIGRRLPTCPTKSSRHAKKGMASKMPTVSVCGILRSVCMPLFAWMLLLAASSSVELVDHTYQIPANDWSFVDLGLRPRSALVMADFAVEAGPPVQLLLMEREDLERLNRGEPHGMVLSTAVGPAGHLEVPTGNPGDYVVVVENRSGRAETSKVRLRVSIDS